MTNADLQKIMNSEIAHSVYQALCRGSCRLIDGTQARQMNAWLIHRTAGLKDALSEVMPGLVWKPWATKYLQQKTKRSGHVASIAARLDALGPEVSKLSITELKRALGLAAPEAMSTFSRALVRFLAETMIGIRSAGRWSVAGTLVAQQ